MAPVIVDTDAIRAFADRAALEEWYRAQHGTATELWLKVHKKGSALPSVTTAEALDVALCWGWIDGIRKAFDAHSFVQRYTPRSRTSIWSKANIANVERLRLAGRLQAAGEAEVKRAQDDGRWARAYGDFKDEEFPDDLLAAITAVPEALALFNRLTAQNRFALAFRTHGMKTAAGRAKKIAGFVEMLRRGETIHPNGENVMTRYVAFLRGVNLGKRSVKGDELRAAFEAMGFRQVKTLLASGNVLFDAGAEAGLKEKIEAGLRAQFGFEIGTVLRSLDALREMVAADPFGGVMESEAAKLHVTLFDAPIPAGFTQAPIAGDFDVPTITAREIFLIVHRKADGTYLGRSGLDTEKRLPKGTLVTSRNWNTILKALA